jgi:hypothetical protein
LAIRPTLLASPLSPERALATWYRRTFFLIAPLS